VSAVLASVGEKDRRTYLGGSDVAAVLGIDPYGKTPLTCYLAKIGELQGTIDAEKKKFLARRKRWESPIVEMLREEFDGKIVAVNQRYVDPEHDFLAAEIDFEWADADGVIQNGEIKTVSPFAFNEGAGWGAAGSDEIPVHYHAQVMHGLMVTGRQTCILAAMAGLDTMVFYRIERDDETISGMREAEVSFWRDHVLAKVPPEPITMSDAMRLFNRRKGRPVELDDEAAEAFENLRLVRDKIKAFEGDQAALELLVAKFVCKAWSVDETLIEVVADNALLTHSGATLGKWAAGKGSHLDQARLASEYPEIKKALTVEHFFRSFRFTKKP
jgi:putative phage-type endonuclease